MLELYRTGETFHDDHGVEGYRSLLLIGSFAMYAIERGDGYKWMRPGEYECELGRMANGARAIRILGDYSKGRIYIHPANKPSDLLGCIAPGLKLSRAGVDHSKQAMLRLFADLGGWEIGRKCTLRVCGTGGR